MTFWLMLFSNSAIARPLTLTKQEELDNGMLQSKSYRLGDIFFRRGEAKARQVLAKNTLNLFPGSVAAKFLEYEVVHEQRQQWNLTLLGQILNATCDENKTMPRVIHLRLGDAVCGNTSAMRQRRPHSAHDTIATIRRLNSTDGAILWGSHNEMCIDASLKYVKRVSEMTGWQILEGSADEHLCLMIKAKLFIAGVGSYSQLAVELRNVSGLPSLMDLRPSSSRSSSVPSSSKSARDKRRTKVRHNRPPKQRQQWN
jgi:hypothetical protein